jgi:hypothetical protein
LHLIKAVVFIIIIMKSVEIKERVKELASACGIVTLTERQFVFNQLYMQFINLNNIQSQGKTYKDVYPKIVQHFIDFEIISKGYRENKFDSFLDEVNDYLMQNVYNPDEKRKIYDLLEGCLGAKIIKYDEVNKSKANNDKL